MVIGAEESPLVRCATIRSPVTLVVSWVVRGGTAGDRGRTHTAAAKPPPSSSTRPAPISSLPEVVISMPPCLGGIGRHQGQRQRQPRPHRDSQVPPVLLAGI